MMNHEINQQLDEARQGVFCIRKIRAMLEELIGQKNVMEKKVEELKGILEKEDIDVAKLEGNSLTHIFHSVLGNLDEKLQKEQQEALAAHLKYDQAVQDLKHIKNEIDQLHAEELQYKDVENRYQELFDKKKLMLLQSNRGTAEHMIKLTEQISAEKHTLKEIHEAINAGYNVMNHIDNTLKSLNSAEGWGTWDLLGGGIMSDLMKHGHIDDAKSEAEKTQRALLRFKTELTDIKINSTIQIETDGFARFADFFFDGLIADWYMQSRINESQVSVMNIKNQVQNVMNKLDNMETNLRAQMEQLENELKEYVVNSHVD